MILVGESGEGVAELQWLLDHPALASSADEFKSLQVKELRETDSSHFVCVLQKEFATASPEHVKFIGTDDLTTCVGLGIRNPRSELTSVGHLDSTECVKEGLAQMLASLSPEGNTTLEVHIVGAYDDLAGESPKEADEPGFSWPLCMELVEALHTSPYKLEIKTLCILQHNTVGGEDGYTYPVVRGFAIEMKSGRCFPASFSPEARGPDPVVRGLALYAAHPVIGLRSAYETKLDKFSIKPFHWTRALRNYAAYYLSCSDAELLETRSTSPHAEGPDFVKSLRRMDAYIYDHPDWKETFPNEQSRAFVRNIEGGGWTRVSEPNKSDASNRGGDVSVEHLFREKTPALQLPEPFVS